MERFQNIRNTLTIRTWEAWQSPPSHSSLRRWQCPPWGRSCSPCRTPWRTWSPSEPAPAGTWITNQTTWAKDFCSFLCNLTLYWFRSPYHFALTGPVTRDYTKKRYGLELRREELMGPLRPLNNAAWESCVSQFSALTETDPINLWINHCKTLLVQKRYFGEPKVFKTFWSTVKI